MGNAKHVRVLLVEDSPAEAQRIQILLKQFKSIPFEVIRTGESGELPTKTRDSRARDISFEVTLAKSLSEGLKKTIEIDFDIMVLELSMLNEQGLANIKSTRQKVNNIPSIVLLNLDDINLSQTTFESVARDHLVPDNSRYDSLMRSMDYVLHRTDMETRNPLLVAALEATSNAVLITGHNASIEWINPAFTELTGYSLQEAVGHSPKKLLKSDVHDQAFYEQMWQKLLKEEHWEGEVVNKRKDGNLYNAHVSISPVFNKHGLLSGYVQIQRDITDSVVLLAVSEALQHNKPLDERFKQVMDILFNLRSFNLQNKGGVFLKAKGENSLSLFVLNGEFSAEFIEKEQCVKYGACLCGRAAVSGELLISDDCFCDSRHEHTFIGMQPHGHYIVPITYCGEVFGILFLYTDCHPVRTQTRLAMLKQVGEMMALTICQEEAKKTVEMARDVAMQASLVKSEFLANMSHEIRTPMNGVLGMLDLLSETDMTATQQDWVETAHKSATALLDIINDILDLSKVEAGKLELHTVDFNLIDLIEDICVLLAKQAHSKSVELNCSLPVNMPARWQGDPIRIRQVLTNLLGNAIKFTEQGEVLLTLAQVITNTDDHVLRFEIQDTGIGIPEDVQIQLFQPFSQADGSTSRRFGGSGLGLFISKKLIELMGGTIAMTSHLGVGSCFWFTLPLKPSESSKVDQKSYDFSGKHILVVDDNATNRDILTAYLNNWGFTVSENDNGTATLIQLQSAAIQNTLYDVILLDMQMPVMDGLTLANCLSQIPALAKIPIILLSSGDQLNAADYKNTNIVQRLIKPVRQIQLLDAIINALQGNLEATKKVAKPAIQLPSYEGKKILIVEDNKINQKVIVAKLSKFGITTDIAENGQIALDKWGQNTYDLILMDCQMPVMDGFIATRHIRSIETNLDLSHQIIIALTATAIEGDRQKCLAAGMDDYLSKPIVDEQLIKVLAQRLGTKSVESTFNLNVDNAPVVENVWDELTALNNLGDDKELLYDIIELYLIEAPKQLVELSNFQQQGNLLELANIAHTIKGTSSNFYANQVTECASLLEKAARSEQAVDFYTLTKALIDAVTDLLNQLQIAHNRWQNHLPTDEKK
jgi:PAS domain S-box-containing protein